MDKEMIYGDEEDLRKNRSAAGGGVVRAVALLRLSCRFDIPM